MLQMNNVAGGSSDFITMNNTLPVYTTQDMQKAIEMAQMSSSEEMRLRYKMIEQAQKMDQKSVFIDPNNVLNYVGTRSKPTAISYAILRAMAQRCKPVAAIIKTRLNKMSKFTRRPRHEHDTGFKIMLKDADRKMTPAEKKRAFEIEEIILTGGIQPNAVRKDTFNQFTRKVIRDSLTLDALAWENVFSRAGKWTEMWAMDAATIEIVVDTRYGPDYPVYIPETQKALGDAGNIAYVQRVNGQITAEYTDAELCYGIRNPRTDLNYAMFGMSELEEMIETVTYILNAEAYNGAYFDQSNLPQGILSIVGNYDEEQLEEFKRKWDNLTSGVVGKWSVPVFGTTDGQGVEFKPFKQSSKDMEYHQWLTFLTTIACAIYQISPKEINMESYSAGGKSSLSGDDTQEQFKASDDRGFEPLALFYEDLLNAEVVNQIDPNFVLRFQGINEEDEQRKWDLMEKKLNMGYTTVALERKKNDEEPILDPKTGAEAEWTQMPANQVLAGFAQSATQAAQQQQQADDDHERGMEQLAAQHAMGMYSQDKQAQNQMQLQDRNNKFADITNQENRMHDMQKMDKQHQQGMEQLHAQQKFQDVTNQETRGHDMNKMDKQHMQSKELAQIQHQQQLQTMDKQQRYDDVKTQEQRMHDKQEAATGRDHEMQKMDKQHQLNAAESKDQHSRDLQKMGLQHGLNEKSAKNQHGRELDKMDVQQAYAHAEKVDDREYAEKTGNSAGTGGNPNGRRKKVQGKGSSQTLKKALETTEGIGSTASAEQDDIIIVIRLD